jgi:hypothetical protein
MCLIWGDWLFWQLEYYRASKRKMAELPLGTTVFLPVIYFGESHSAVLALLLVAAKARGLLGGKTPHDRYGRAPHTIVIPTACSVR